MYRDNPAFRNKTDCFSDKMPLCSYKILKLSFALRLDARIILCGNCHQ